MRRSAIVAAGTVAAVGAGLCLGVRLDNLHNGLLSVSFAVVGNAVLSRRPDQREAQLFVAAGAAQSVVFLGRQVGSLPGVADHAWAPWVAWCGVWPLPLVLALVGATVMCFPDGRFPGAGWRAAFWVMLSASTVLAVMSALWPVDYDRTGLAVEHPLDLAGSATASAIFDRAQPLCFAAFQLVWLACVVARWAHPGSDHARQLRWLVAAVAASVVVLAVGLLVDGSPRAGLLTVPLIPVAAGIAIVESSYESMVREVRSAAERVVVAQDDARRRIERDLHDGAQHRLVVLGMDLGRVVDRAQQADDPELVAAATDARRQLLVATAELRELARGIHPAVLTQDGLPAALAYLADSCGVPVTLTVENVDRCAPQVEATAYYVVAEALTNVVRHSGASRVSVKVHTEDGVLGIAVQDDGCGGAVPGGGLRGLADRVTSLGGAFEVDSPVGAGTRIAAELACR